jgi:hypothetical protein
MALHGIESIAHCSYQWGETIMYTFTKADKSKIQITDMTNLKTILRTRQNNELQIGQRNGQKPKKVQDNSIVTCQVFDGVSIVT